MTRSRENRNTLAGPVRFNSGSCPGQPGRGLARCGLIWLLVIGTPSALLAEVEDGREESRPQAPPSAATDDSQQGERGAEGIRLTDEVLEEFGIRLATAGPGRIERALVLPAEVRPNEDRLAHIAPRFPGIVTEVRSRVGDHVEAGQVLAVIESSASLAPYSLKTAISGVVIAKHVTRGEPVSREAQTFVVADLSDVWIDISAYQKDVGKIRVGQRVLVSAGHGLTEAEGTVSYLAPVVDEETRTTTARVVLPNPESLWRPGMFVTAKIIVDEAKVPIAIPRTALEIIDDQTVVFVRDENGFKPRAIGIGRQDTATVEVVSGLQGGEHFVSHGGFTLKAELARDELSGGHGH